MRIDVAHVQVQGDAAPDQMIRALKYFNSQEQLPEIIVIIRGGGSADDLSAFNDELLVREIARSRVPTVVGVGHEIDETLADMVADLRAATPSNAAQLIVPDRREIIQSVRHSRRQIIARLEYAIEQRQRLIREKLQDAAVHIERKLHVAEQELAMRRQVLEAFDPRAVLARGYALVRGDETPGGIIEIEKSDKLITAEVTNVKAN